MENQQQNYRKARADIKRIEGKKMTAESKLDLANDELKIYKQIYTRAIRQMELWAENNQREIVVTTDRYVYSARDGIGKAGLACEVAKRGTNGSLYSLTVSRYKMKRVMIDSALEMAATDSFLGARMICDKYHRLFISSERKFKKASDNLDSIKSELADARARKSESMKTIRRKP